MRFIPWSGTEDGAHHLVGETLLPLLAGSGGAPLGAFRVVLGPAMLVVFSAWRGGRRLAGTQAALAGADGMAGMEALLLRPTGYWRARPGFPA